MRPKTFPAAPYVGNTRQRLQEIKEGLKQPAKLVSQALHGGSSRSEGGRAADCKSGKDTASRQQQLRPPQKFNNYQNALREIRKSLMPFANESGPSSGSGHPAGAGEVNRQMLQELVNAGCDQEMAVRALKQTGSRNIEAALEYISKMGYLDPRNEFIVRVIKQTSPGKAGMPNSMDHRPALEAPGEAGAMPPYHQMGAPMYEGAGGYGPEGEMPRPYMGAPPVMNYMMPPSGAPQGPAMGNPMGRPPSMGTYPPVMASQSNPANPMYPPGAQQKGYPGSMEQHGPMMSYNVPGQPLQLQPQPPGGPVPGPHYDYGHARPHMMEPAGYGVKRTASFQNKMAPPPMAPPDNYVNMQGKGAMGQNGPGGAGGGYPGNLYLPPHSHPRQASPTSHQVHMMSRSPGAVAAMGPDFSDMPQGLMTPSRASLNLDLYEHHWAGPPGPEGAPQARQPQPQGPFRGEVRVPSRTNSFNSRSAGPNGVRPAMAAPPTAGKQDPSLGPPNTITAVTSPPIQQPVKSIRVMRPEPKTAVGPCHPSWMAAQAQDAAEPLAYMPEETYSLEPAQEPRCPPPPYPKNLLMSGAEEGAGVICGAQELNTPATRSTHGGSGGSGKGEESQQVKEKTKMSKGEKTVKDKKQIQTSPVPVRKNGRDEEKRESRIKTYSPFAFKFYMEQHIENVMKTHQQKLNRRLQLEQEMSKAGLSEAEQEQMRKMLNQKESNYNRLRRAKMDKSMFVKIKTLGIGAFGEVCLTRKVDTGALYAMKTLRKKDVLNRNQVAHVKAERDILAEADNEWVVRLYYSFQDRDSLYFVMDYIPGGDMMSLLIRMGVFPEPLARFYVAELTLAIESVHKMGFIHRDIKPDNILIDLDGHIKLTDFGLCTGFRWTHNSKYYQKGSHVRQDSMEPSDFWDDVSNCRCGDRLMTLEQRANRQHQRCLAHSLVGTPNYIAPEVLLRKGYTQLCDWWSVGVILFEMLVGQPPFLAPTPTETQIKVINWESTLQVPPQVKLSPEAVDIIGRLCCSAEDRLGANGAGEIKAHPFFTQMDFSSNLRQQPAPYRPKIAHPMDTSNFDPVEEEGGPGAWSDSGDSTRALDTLCSPHGKHPEHAFYEFTFRRFFDDNGCPFRYPKPLEASEVSLSMGPEEEDEQEEEEEEEEEEQEEVIRPVCTFRQVMALCASRLANPSLAAEHYQAVCRALFVETLELQTFLIKIRDAKEMLKKITTEEALEDRSTAELDALKHRDWARLWVQLMKELRQGVKLKKVREQPFNLLPTEFSLTPFEMLMQDIRARKFQLRKVMVDGDIPTRVKRNAHELILDFIRSRPPLKPVSERSLPPPPPQQQSLHDQVLAEIKQERKLRPVALPSSRPFGSLPCLAQTCPCNIKSTSCIDLSVSEPGPRQPPRPRILLKAPTLAEMEEMNISEEEESPENGELRRAESSPTPLKRDRSFSEHDLAMLRAEMLPSLSESVQLGGAVRLRGERPRSRTLTGAGPPPNHRASFPVHGWVPPSPARLSLSSVDETTEGSETTSGSRAGDEHQWMEEFSHPVESLALTVDEVINVRRVLVKAEMEKFLQSKELYNNLKKGKVCCCCRVKFPLFSWPSTCLLCKRSVCVSCSAKMKIPSKKMAHIPVYTVGFHSTPKSHGHKSQVYKSLRTLSRHSVEEEFPHLYAHGCTLRDICAECTKFVADVISSSRRSLDILNNTPKREPKAAAAPQRPPLQRQSHLETFPQPHPPQPHPQCHPSPYLQSQRHSQLPPQSHHQQQRLHASSPSLSPQFHNKTINMNQ